MEKKYFIEVNSEGKFDENAEINEFVEFKNRFDNKIVAVGIKPDGMVNIIYYTSIKFVKKASVKVDWLVWS